MIISVTLENSHLYGDVIPSIFRLRHQGFKERQNYDVPSYNGMEYDEYDTPATTYLAWRDENNIVRGCIRLFSTTRPYMIEKIWPETISANDSLPKQENIWEASRICIDRTLPVDLRRQIHGEILCALQEFGLDNNIGYIIGVMSPGIWRSVFSSAKWPVKFMGPKYYLNEKEAILTGKLKICKNILSDIQTKFGIEHSVLIDTETNYLKKAI